jgi:two-component system, OmpR family, alkaline phosphatase synthesis response regulator PhoP
MPPSTTASAQPGDADVLVGRILIADDNQQNRELLEAYLVDDGHEILMAADGRQTLDVTLEQKPDLILLDIMMPKLSGYEVCQRLKENPTTRNIPVLMVTALRDMGDIEKAVAAGADDFLSKPVHRLELKTRVRSLLRVRHLTNERDRLLAYLAEVEQTALR